MPKTYIGISRELGDMGNEIRERMYELYFRGRIGEFRIYTAEVEEFCGYVERSCGSVVRSIYVSDDPKRCLTRMVSNDIVDAGGKNAEKIANEILWISEGYGKDTRMTENTWFTSDQHFNHANIIRYCGRPWNSGFDSDGNMLVSESDVERMNSDMIERWNSVVGKDDIVWCLGDFCLGRNQDEVIPELVRSLNGRINLVLGNHDRHSVKFYYGAGFNRVYDRKVIVNDFVILSHAPVEFLGGNTPFYNVFGHVHDSKNHPTFTRSSCCVCVERHDYRPVPWKTIENDWRNRNGEDSSCN